MNAQMEEKKSSLFSEFTGKYALSKTLRFELKPVGKTEDLLRLDKEEKEKLFPKDKKKAENYQSMKYYIDLLHKDFIEKALYNLNINFSDFDVETQEGDDDSVDNVDVKKDFLQKLRTRIAKDFSKNSYLFGKDIITFLEKKFREKNGSKEVFNEESNRWKLLGDKDAPSMYFVDLDGKEKTVFQDFVGFTGYLRGFHENRKNLYKDDGKAGRVITRIVDENLPRFIENEENYTFLISRHKEVSGIFSRNWEEYYQEKGGDQSFSLQDFLLLAEKYDNVFKREYYKNCLTQRDIEKYNFLVRKLNQNINEYRQGLISKSKESGVNKKVNVRFFKEMHKQILGTVRKRSDYLEVTSENICEKFSDFVKHSDERKNVSKKIIEGVLKGSFFEGVYLSGQSINTISSKWFFGWNFLAENLRNSEGKKKIDFIPLSSIKSTLDALSEANAEDIFKREIKSPQPRNHWDTFLSLWKKEWEDMESLYDKAKSNAEEKIKEYDPSVKQTMTQEQKNAIKDFADASLSLYQMTKYFSLFKGIKEVSKNDKNENFYRLLDVYFFGGDADGCEMNDECEVYAYYNAFRNFFTKKPWSEEKIKLSFDSGNPLKNGTRTIFFKDLEGKYYVGIIVEGKGRMKDYEKSQLNISENDSFQRMFYRQLKFQTLAGKAYIRDFKKKYSEDDDGIEHLKDLISRQFVSEYPMLDILLNKEHKTKKEFDADVIECMLNCYSFLPSSIKKEFVLKKVEDNELYLFEIFSKDFQKESKKNINSLLFHLLFSGNALNQVKLNNEGAEIFFREKSAKKNLEKRSFPRLIPSKKRYTENKIFLHIPISLNYKSPSGKFSKGLINRKVSEMIIDDDVEKKAKIIGIDRGEKNLAYYSVIDQLENILEQGTFNRIYQKDVNGKYIQKSEKKIDFKEGKYILCETGKSVPYVDYVPLLECKEKNRLLERKSWDSIEGIKDLKRGYASQVVHQIAEMVLRYFEQDGVPPLVVFENLNSGFKQGRQRVERQTYQRLELDLAKKLNYLFDKGRKENEVGGIFKGLQLVPEVHNYKSDVEKTSQLGTILYVDPGYTSTTCPNCGFRKRISKIMYESVEKTIQKFGEYAFEMFFEDNRYKFSFVVKQNFGDEDKEKEFQEYVYSDVERVYWDGRGVGKKEGGRGEMKNIDERCLSNKITELLQGKRIDMTQEILVQLKNKFFSKENAPLWRELLWCLNMIFQIRNSENVKFYLSKDEKTVDSVGENRDFLHCPSCHFHSDRPDTWGLFGKKFDADVRERLLNRGEDIFNGDANGAYNIARKGIIALQKIRKHPKDINNFLQRNKNLTQYELEEIFKKKNGRCEIVEGKGKNKRVVDLITKYPNLYVYNSDWDEFLWSQK